MTDMEKQDLYLFILAHLSRRLTSCAYIGWPYSAVRSSSSVRPLPIKAKLYRKPL